MEIVDIMKTPMIYIDHHSDEFTLMTSVILSDFLTL